MNRALTAQNTTARPTSVLATVRAMGFTRTHSLTEALSLAERQAHRLRRLLDLTHGSELADALAGLPRIEIRQLTDVPVSGSSFWNGRSWIITTSADDAPTRQAFTLAHEYKHIIDHPTRHHRIAGTGRRTEHEARELVCDYFAGCLLVPRPKLKLWWGQGTHQPTVLARRFGVSAHAMRVRLSQVGLTEPARRCSGTGGYGRRHGARDGAFDGSAGRRDGRVVSVGSV